MALFSRAGEQLFFMPLQFGVALPDSLIVNAVPNIYNLVELKDNYHRYVVMISTEEHARILEINLGSVTEVLWKKHPQLRERVGREWTKEVYQNHRRDRADRFIKEEIGILSNRVAEGGYSHLILAGQSSLTGRIRKALPKPLALKLIDVMPASSTTSFSKIVESSIASFVEAEERESRAVAEELVRQIHTGGLAVAGIAGSFQALKSGTVDLLVLTKTFAPAPGWICLDCDSMGVDSKRPATCCECGSATLRTFDVKEEMVRLAEQKECEIEVVGESVALNEFEGVGCLLRYREEYAR